jgi:hypothetical protein
MSTFFSIKIKKCEDMFDCCGFQMSVWDFFDSLAINYDKTKAKIVDVTRETVEKP